MTYERVLTKRSEIRRRPPDILITNYKMLDLLLQRGDDLPLWDGADLAYVVLDEFHTYDGAQGTDVAMLLRRLAAATGRVDARTVRSGRSARWRPRRPWASGGDGADSGEAIRKVAAEVFGVAFDADSIVGEERYRIDEFIPRGGLRAAAAGAGGAGRDPRPGRRRHGHGADRPGRCWAARTSIRCVLGRALKRHILTSAVLDVLGGKPKTAPEILELLPRKGAYSWGAALRTRPEQAAAALARFVALLSMARNPDAPSRPLLNIETHLWVRSVSRLLRAVGPRAGVRVVRRADAAAGTRTTPRPSRSSRPTASRCCPAVYCRHCGRSGWAALSPERRAAAAGRRPGADLPGQRGAGQAPGAGVHPGHRRGDPVERCRCWCSTRRPGTCGRTTRSRGAQGGLVVLGDRLDDDRAAQTDTCPACDGEQGIRFLGQGIASLASVAVTQLFTGGELAGPSARRCCSTTRCRTRPTGPGSSPARSYTLLAAGAARRHSSSRACPRRCMS